MNNVIKIAIAAAAGWFLFKDQISAALKPATSSATTAAPATATVPAVTDARLSALTQAGGAGSLSWDVWAWHWQNSAKLGAISPVQMDQILAGADRSQVISAAQFLQAAVKAGL